MYLNDAADHINDSNRVVLYWTHGDKPDPKPNIRSLIDRLLGVYQRLSKIVTCSTINEQRLLSWGIPEGMVTMIPIGVDVAAFRPTQPSQRAKMRETMGIPSDAVCVGSFQKDGEGWGEGLEPKLEKGPDLFLEVIAKLAAEHKVFVLLTGPSRGYVKQGLDRIGVPYHHSFLRHFYDVIPYYQCLDLYMVASRDEGGPNSILESMATGVPIITSRVGIAPQAIEQGKNGFIVDVGDTQGLADCASALIRDSSLRSQFAEGGLSMARSFDWSVIAKQYHEKVFAPLMIGSA
jgi:glycosyltransferase involved in cell wall biosynthesis